MEDRYKATNITVHDNNQLLTISWKDGHESRYPLEGLRRACPCVFCRGGHENMGKPIDPAVFRTAPTRQWKITDLQLIGNYAIQIHWNDGHKTGIFKFESLRDMCPAENAGN